MKAEETEPNSKFGDSRKFDPNFKGPTQSRSCTDVLCCLLFILALMGYFAVGILAWSQGDPRKVIYPTDSRGDFCGQQGTKLEKKPLLFYFNILKCASPLVLLEFQCPTTQICVEKCPDRFLTLAKAKRKTEDLQFYSQFCKEGVNITQTTPELLRDRACPAMIFPSKPCFSRPQALQCIKCSTAANVSSAGRHVTRRYLVLFQFYNLFLFFWCVNFVVALGHVTLAGAFASYYWAAKKPDDIPAFPIFSSLSHALRCVIRVTLEYLDHKLKGAENRCAKFLLSCLKCCFWCLEKCIKFINRNAYIMVAIYGKNFCTSAKDAFFLLMRNIIRVAVLDKVTDFLNRFLFFFSGRIKAVEEAAPSLNYYWVPILTVVFGTYLIAHGFFSVYGMCVDTLFLCFCEDLERNDGSPERPYLMSSELHDILSVSKATEEQEDRGDGEEEVVLHLKEQQRLKQENEEKTPLMQETALKQEVALAQEVPLKQEIAPTQGTTRLQEMRQKEATNQTQEAVSGKEEKEEQDELALAISPQKAVQQNRIYKNDMQETEESQGEKEKELQKEQQEPEVKNQENGPEERKTPLMPQNE
ncbi:hypothetical protein HF521_000011 [Silurus meridionalis]|uniref:Choline transporter-like protein n=1 Tax=Silurus meridionalis TaxID=175797 RepID=A0A8T0BZA5_SILME|nr:hypothetical protein HF521_000011 [Silurus meridionalis]